MTWHKSSQLSLRLSKVLSADGLRISFCYDAVLIIIIIQGGPEKTAQTLMRYNFSTAGHRVTRLPAKCSETNW